MTPAITGAVIVGLVWLGTTQTPSEPPGQRVESESYTAPQALTRCITYNINKKMPELLVRSFPADSPDEGGYLVLTAPEPTPTTFGVIRVERREDGSRLTTWLPDRSVSTTPEDLARRLIAGC